MPVNVLAETGVGKLVGGAGLGIASTAGVCLEPQDVSLDAGGDSNSWRLFGDDVSARQFFEISFLEGVDDAVLMVIEYESYDLLRIADVADMVFGGAPVCEVIAASEFPKGLFCLLNGGYFEYFAWIISFHEPGYGRDFLHLEGKEDGAAGQGSG